MHSYTLSLSSVCETNSFSSCWTGYVQSKDLCWNILKISSPFVFMYMVVAGHYSLFVSAHSSKTHSDESRPELVLRLTLGSLAVSVLHIDPLPPPHAAPSPLGPMAAHFFSMVGPGQLEPAAFLQSRTVFNQACPHDHLRCTSNFN